MARVKRGNVARKRRKKILNLAKGFRGGLSKLFRQARPAVFHALSNAYRDRKRKKGDFRRLWIARLSAATTERGISYSKFMGQLKKKDIQINRKMLSELAINNKDVFSEIVELAKK